MGGIKNKAISVQRYAFRQYLVPVVLGNRFRRLLTSIMSEVRYSIHRNSSAEAEIVEGCLNVFTRTQYCY
jgi:hypothetical protein